MHNRYGSKPSSNASRCSENSVAILDPEKNRVYKREWTAKRRVKYLATLGDRCIKCGSQYELELDHKDPSQKVDHRIWSWRESRLLEELAKCQLLCHICHVKKTNVDVGYREVEHGTNLRYTSRGCRCMLCKAAHAEVNRRYR